MTASRILSASSLMLVFALVLGAPVPEKVSPAATESSYSGPIAALMDAVALKGEDNPELRPRPIDFLQVASTDAGVGDESHDDVTAPTWPGGYKCDDKSNLIFNAYTTAPTGLPDGTLRGDTPGNSCTMVCLPKGIQGVAENHGVHVGGTCFGTNDNSLFPTYGDGSPIPEGTEICPGAEFYTEGKTAGVQYFTYKCAGTVIDYGAPYK
mmetsp:Transcript_18904/g.63341  ORF Transcript_18904/g.63341 Transcript_18904/m.63341 type:complete len:209 (-) Transcript_18904:730-1356(-)